MVGMKPHEQQPYKNDAVRKTQVVCPQTMLRILDAARQSYNDMLRTTCWGQECAAQPRCIDFFASRHDWMVAAEAAQRHEQTRASAQFQSNDLLPYPDHIPWQAGLDSACLRSSPAL